MDVMCSWQSLCLLACMQAKQQALLGHRLQCADDSLVLLMYTSLVVFMCNTIEVGNSRYIFSAGLALAGEMSMLGIHYTQQQAQDLCL